MSSLTTYPLRLPRSIKAAAEELSKADGTSLNQFVATAVAEKVAALKTAAFFEERRQRATGAALAGLLERTEGEALQPGDEVPESWLEGRKAAGGGAKSLPEPSVPVTSTRPRRGSKPAPA